MPDRAAQKVETDLTPEMIRAGLAAFRNWDSEQEEEVALVTEIYLSMKDARAARRDPP